MKTWLYLETYREVDDIYSGFLLVFIYYWLLDVNQISVISITC